MNIFFNHAGESGWSARYPSANQNVSTVPKRKGQLSLCAILIGAEVMKSEVPPQELCQPWSTGSLRLSTQENYTLKCMHAFGLGNSIFFFLAAALIALGNKPRLQSCMPGEHSTADQWSTILQSYYPQVSDPQMGTLQT